MFKKNFSSRAPGRETLHKKIVVSTKPTTIAAIIIAAISESSVHKNLQQHQRQGNFLSIRDLQSVTVPATTSFRTSTSSCVVDHTVIAMPIVTPMTRYTNTTTSN
jgi:hypothetical protein